MSTLPRANPGGDFASTRRFVLRQRLGEGSMGAVYLVTDREVGVEVALKTLRRVDASGIYRFKREFRALSDVSHPSLVKLHELFCEEGEWFFTMEYVEGKHFLDYVLDRGEVRVSRTPQPTEELDERATGDLVATHDFQVRGLELLFPTPLKDEERLRAVLAQVAEALLAVHAAGHLHRDLKSDNVLVTREGRAVLLDFGIVVERGPQLHKTLEPGLLGTPAYMSPEQAAGGDVDEATDWYALGVMLYEALTGTLPFDGTYRQIIRQKQLVDPLPPSQVVSGVPVDLDQLCVQLLVRNPEARPRGRAVLAALQERRAAHLPPPAASMIPEPEQPMVGRSAELAVLDEALRSTESTRPVLVFVHGASGMGKTTLVDAFLSRARQDEATVVLRGVCYERESVPFKAFDNLVDGLSRYLRRLSPVRAAELVPRDVQALAHLFPVLQRVEAIKDARRRGTLSRDPHEIRRRAFSALKELLCRITDQRPLCLSIDDLHWGDVDSARLLGELLSGPEGPAMLVLCSYRSGEAEGSPCLRALFTHTRDNPHLDVRELAVGALSPEQSYELAHKLLGPREQLAASAVGAESEGSPFLLTELARHLEHKRRADGHLPAVISLGELVAERVQTLSADARLLLLLVSVAGQPVPEHILALAPSFDIDLQTALSELRGLRLLRGVAARGGRAVDVYHDRIRQAVLAQLDPETLARWHRRLATTLEASGSEDLEALCLHLLGAGDFARAGLYALRAAAQASAALAFDKAARLYAIANEHYRGEPWERRELLAKWGDALVNAGRGMQAARVYFEAAADAGESEAAPLRRKAAVQLLRSGRFERGMEVLRDTLPGFGLAPEATFKDAFRAAQSLRAELKARGFVFVRRGESEVRKEVLERLDASWDITLGMLLCEVEQTLPLVVGFVRDALEVGEPLRLARGLCLFHVYVDTGMAEALGERPLGALDLAHVLSLQTEEPSVRAWVAFAKGCEHLSRGDLKRATRHVERAEEIFRSHCTGSAAEMRLCRQLLGSLLVASAALEDLGKCEEWAREAEEHDDLIGATRLRLLSTTFTLVKDAPMQAERTSRDSMLSWGRSRFDVTALLHQVSVSLVALYRGEREACLALAAKFDPFFGSALAGFPLWRGQCHLLRALLLLTASESSEASEALVQRAEQDLAALERMRLPYLTPHATLLRACIEAATMRHESALALLDSILHSPLMAADAPVVRAYARRRKGELLGGEEGAQLVAEADDYMRSRGVKNPELLGRLYSPLPRVSA